MIETNDFIGIVIVYVYVVSLLLITEKGIKNKVLSRKILHIMVGNIAFLLPIFLTKEIMAFIAAAPFIIFTFLMSSHTPIKSIKGKTSSAGHSMGLVYYSITWTILAYIFFDTMVVIAIAIFSMSYGDGLASIFGVKYGRKKYNITGDEKSYIGTIAMFFFTFVMIIIAILYYQFINQYFFSFSLISVIFILVLSMVGAIVEGLTPKGLDNLTVPFVISILFWYIFIN
jgi:dolichol kinase